MRRALILCMTALMVGLLFLATGWRRDGSPAHERADLVIALAGDATTLDPHMTGNVGIDLSLLSHIYPALVVRDASMRLRPELATSWDRVAPDRWTFHLVKGATFENGEPIDAYAVVWNFERIRNPDLHARIATWFKPIQSMRALDASTVEIITKAPFNALPSQLSMLLLLPPHWTATHSPARETMSGGPYRLVEHVSGSEIRLSRNSRYWGRPAEFANVNFRIIPSPTARVAALMAGEVDLVSGLPIPEIDKLKSAAKIDAGSIASNRSVFIKLNTLKPPLNDPRVRQALNYAIDKQAIADGLFAGKAPVSNCQILTPAYVGFNPALRAYPHDVAKARRLLKDAGALGATLTLETPSNNALQGSEVTQAVAAQLEAAGLRIRLLQIDNAYYMDKFLKARDLGDMSLLTHAWPTLEADGVLSLFQSESPYAYYKDTQLDRLLPLARSASDPTQQAAIYAQITKRFCDQAAGIFLYTQPITYAVSPRILWRARGDDWLRAMDITRRPQIEEHFDK